jgi:hypothetical protein
MDRPPVFLIRPNTDAYRKTEAGEAARLISASASLTASSYIFSVNSGHCLMFKTEPVSLKLRSAAVRAMMARPIQKRTKKPVKLAYSLVGSK